MYDLLCSTSSLMHAFADDSTLHTSSFFDSQPSSANRAISRIDRIQAINTDLEKISEWGSENFIRFNASKTQFLPISLSTNPSHPSISFEDSLIEPLPSINILGVQIASNLSWSDHIVQISKFASRNLGVLFRCLDIFLLISYLISILASFSPV